jgi:hypothetical protein
LFRIMCQYDIDIHTHPYDPAVWTALIFKHHLKVDIIPFLKGNAFYTFLSEPIEYETLKDVTKEFLDFFRLIKMSAPHVSRWIQYLRCSEHNCQAHMACFFNPFPGIRAALKGPSEESEETQWIYMNAISKSYWNATCLRELFASSVSHYIRNCTLVHMFISYGEEWFDEVVKPYFFSPSSSAPEEEVEEIHIKHDTPPRQVRILPSQEMITSSSSSSSSSPPPLDLSIPKSKCLAWNHEGEKIFRDLSVDCTCDDPEACSKTVHTIFTLPNCSCPDTVLCLRRAAENEKLRLKKLTKTTRNEERFAFSKKLFDACSKTSLFEIEKLHEEFPDPMFTSKCFKQKHLHSDGKYYTPLEILDKVSRTHLEQPGRARNYNRIVLFFSTKYQISVLQFPFCPRIWQVLILSFSKRRQKKLTAHEIDHYRVSIHLLFKDGKRNSIFINPPDDRCECLSCKCIPVFPWGSIVPRCSVFGIIPLKSLSEEEAAKHGKLIRRKTNEDSFCSVFCEDCYEDSI